MKMSQPPLMGKARQSFERFINGMQLRSHYPVCKTHLDNWENFGSGRWSNDELGRRGDDARVLRLFHVLKSLSH